MVLKDVLGTVLLDPVQRIDKFIAIVNLQDAVFVILPGEPAEVAAFGTGEGLAQHLRAKVVEVVVH